MLEGLLSGAPEVRAWLVPRGGDPLAPDPAWISRFLADGGEQRWNHTAILAAAEAGSAAARAWRDAAGTLVVTGQQPALGGGALYTLVKTAASIALAERCTTPGNPVLPLFWCASDDHDLSEASHADLISRTGHIQRVQADFGGGRASLRFRSAATGWPQFINACHQHLGAGAGADWLVAHAPRAEEGLGAWLCRLMRDFFGEERLLACEAWRLRPLWTATLRRAIEHWPAAELAQRRAAVQAAGFADSLGSLDDPPLFADYQAGRELLNRAGAALLLERDPLVLSPGAGLRPILQQAALPAAIAVLGPGELAYHALITPLYAALGVPHPLLVPRPSLSLAPAWLVRGCKAWGTTADRLQRDTSEPPSQRLALTEELAALTQALDRLAASPVPSDLARRRDAGLTRLRRDLDRLSRSLARGERQQAGRPAFGALLAWLWPRGAGQDRSMSLGQAIWENGPGLAEALLAAARVCAPGERRVLSLEP